MIVQNQVNLCSEDVQNHKRPMESYLQYKGILVWDSSFEIKSFRINRQLNETEIISALYKDIINFTT